MDIFAYFRLYRRMFAGEWVYIYDRRLGVCHWTPSLWLSQNRWLHEYQVLDYECW